MRNANERNDSATIARLNDLLQLDHDAVEAYTIAINMVRDGGVRETLADYRADHKRHIEELSELVRAHGGLPTEMPHPTGALKLAVQTIGAAAGDDALLLAFKAVEGQARDKYERATRESLPPGAAAIVAAAFTDEDKHYRWVERTLEQRGVGRGTLPHGLASVVERVHKTLADPIEAVGRTVMENVGNVVGTTRTRAGSAAPSPIDIVTGMMTASDRGSAKRNVRPDPVRDPLLDEDEPGPAR